MTKHKLVIDTERKYGGGRIVFSSDPKCFYCKILFEEKGLVYFDEINDKLMCKECVFKGYGDNGGRSNEFLKSYVKLATISLSQQQIKLIREDSERKKTEEDELRRGEHEWIVLTAIKR